MRPARVLFICGSHNQTTQMEQIADVLPEVEASFTPYFGDYHVRLGHALGVLDATIAGRPAWRRCLARLSAGHRRIDARGENGSYDLVVTCADTIARSRLARVKTVLVQDGMIDPWTMTSAIVRATGGLLPRWLGGTSTLGLSHAYDRFCVASHGYRDMFVAHGVRPERLVVTGIPNFDDFAKFRVNAFARRGYVLVCTTDMRETLRYDNREAFLQQCVEIASGRPLVFKLHPNENRARATAEIMRVAPQALVVQDGCAEEMVANADVLVTQYSSVAFCGLALGKEVHSYFDLDELDRLMPEQHGQASVRIADVCRGLLGLAARRRIVEPIRRVRAARAARAA